MTGLDKIIGKINDDSKNAVNKILDSAAADAEKILSDASYTAEQNAAEIVENARMRAGVITERAKSAAEAESKRRLLSKKQQIISEIIADAKREIKELPEDEYFALLSKLLKQYQTGKNGEIVFSEKDKHRLGKDFLPENIVLSEKSGEFEGGFVLIYGDIEINCTFDAIFEEMYDEFSDTVNKIIFSSL